MNQEVKKVRHPMFLVIIGALMVYQIYMAYRYAMNYLALVSDMFNLGQSARTLLIVGALGVILTLLGLIGLAMFKRWGLWLFLIGLLVSSAGAFLPGTTQDRIMALVYIALQFVAGWIALKVGPSHEEAIEQLE